MKKKLGLLLAIIHEPKLLVLDEPTNGLDAESTHLFYLRVMGPRHSSALMRVKTLLTAAVVSLIEILDK
jgi:ABC-type uncharacterized transport system ATPase subunit